MRINPTIIILFIEIIIHFFFRETEEIVMD